MRLVYPVPEPDVPTLPVKGARWPLRWDGKPDGVMTITDPDSGVVRTFSTPFSSGSFGVVHLPLDSWNDRNGARIDVERDDEGVPFGLRHSGGYYLAVDTQGPRITALRLLDEPPSRYGPDGPVGEGTVVMRYGYDPSGNLTEVVNSSGEPLRFTYDEQGRMTRWTDRNGTWFSYVYDERGRVVRTEGVDGILSGTLTYDEAASTTTYTDSLGHVSSHRYNSEGLVVEETDPLGHVTRTEWDEWGAKPRSITDPLGRATRYGYDEAGNLTELTLPDGSVARAVYNELGHPTEVVEPSGADVAARLRRARQRDQYGGPGRGRDPLHLRRVGTPHHRHGCARSHTRRHNQRSRPTSCRRRRARARHHRPTRHLRPHRGGDRPARSTPVQTPPVRRRHRDRPHRLHLGRCPPGRTDHRRPGHHLGLRPRLPPPSHTDRPPSFGARAR